MLRIAISRRLVFLLALVAGVLLATSRVSADVFTYYANDVPDVENWDYASAAEGNPYCDTPGSDGCFCNTTGAQARESDPSATAHYLIARDFGTFALPSLHNIVSVRVNFLGRYDNGAISNSSRLRIEVTRPGFITANFESDRWSSDTYYCRWRTFAGDEGQELVGPYQSSPWTESDVNSLEIGVRRAGNATDPLRLKAFRLQVTTEYACGNGIIDGKGEQCDLGPGNGAPYACCASDCQFVVGSECRPSAGPCDLPEHCSGTAAGCPIDTYSNPTTVCRASTAACDPAEACTGNLATCPADTNSCAVCPDGACNNGETCASCPQDCGACQPTCPNGACEGSETCSSCAQDCGACPPTCGDGVCNEGESCSSCPEDCSVCCGDSVCGDAGEDCNTCSADCGDCEHIESTGAKPIIDLGKDRRSDLVLFEPADGDWWIDTLGGHRPVGTTKLSTRYQFLTRFGQVGDLPYAADIDGDGRADLVVFRPSTGKLFARSSRKRLTLEMPFTNAPNSTTTMTALDDDGDGRADVTRFVAAEIPDTPSWLRRAGIWTIRLSSTGEVQTVTDVTYPLRADVAGIGAAVADYDGDGRPDRALLYIMDRGGNSQRTEHWVVRFTSNGVAREFIRSGDRTSVVYPVSADYDGDGRAEFGTWVRETGVWRVSQQANPAAALEVQWGLPGDKPIPRLDVDRDGRADFVVWRPSTSTFYVKTSGTGKLKGAIAVPGGWSIPMGRVDFVPIGNIAAPGPGGLPE